MILTAAVLHALLLLIVLPQRERPEQSALALQWVELARPEPTLAAAQSTAPPPEEAFPEPEPEARPQPAPTTEPPTAPAPADDQAPADPPAPSAQRLRELALIAGRAQTERTSPPRPGLEGFTVPRLPSEAGWLNDQVGTVSPYAERWLEADGAGAARVVAASGQVFCGRARAPTAAEEFNPWMSAVVMTWRPCGRERPQPVDRSNPWLRGAGPASD